MHSDLAEVGVKRTDPLSRTAIASSAAGFSGSGLSARKNRSLTCLRPSQPPAPGWARWSWAIRGSPRKRRSPESAAGSCSSACSPHSWPAGSPTCWHPIISVPITRIAEAMRTVPDRDVRAISRPADGRDRRARRVLQHDGRGTLPASPPLRKAGGGSHGGTRRGQCQARAEIAERTRAEAELRESGKELRDLASHLQSSGSRNAPTSPARSTTNWGRR